MTTTAHYPCCNKPARGLPERGRVERRHFCSTDAERGTIYQISVRPIGEIAPGVEITNVEFLDLASTEARNLYGRRRFANRKAQR